jgi:hypothetical protein
LNGYAIKDGDIINVSEFSLQFYWESHSEIIAWQIPCQNIWTIVNWVFANSADSFDIPPIRPEILAVPLSAPWLKIRETLDFIKKVKPKIVVPAHDWLNSELWNMIWDNWIKKVCEKVGSEYRNLHLGELGRFWNY